MTQKVVICGNPGIGKTAILNRLDTGSYTESRATIALSSISYTPTVDNKKLSIQIWDTPGQQTYRDVVKNLFHGAVIIIIAYDITNTQSFDDLPHWYEDVIAAEKPSYIYLVGNKLDLDENRKITHAEASEYAEKIHAIYFETSALDGTNITGLFSDIALKISEMIAPPPEIIISKRDDESTEAGNSCC